MRFTLILITLMAVQAFATAGASLDVAEEVVATPATEMGKTRIEDSRLQAGSWQSSDTAKILSNQVGISLQGGGAVSALPVMRGMADDRLRIKVDGMDLISACANHMNPPLSYLAPAAVGSAEIYAGISPVSQGGDSIGGAISIETLTPKFRTSDTTALASGSIGGFYHSNASELGSNIKLNLAAANTSLSYIGTYASADNYRAGKKFKAKGKAAAGRKTLQADEVGSTHYESINHALNMAWQLEQHLLQLKLAVQDIPEQTWANQRMDMTKNDSTRANLSYEGRYDWGWLKARAYTETTKHEMQFGKDKLYWYSPSPGVACAPSGGRGGCAAGMPMHTKGQNNGALLGVDLQLSQRNILRLGTEAQFFTLDDIWPASGRGMWPNAFVNINNGKRDRLAFYAEWESKVANNLQTQLGLRSEQVKTNADQVEGYNATMANYDAESKAFNAKNRQRTDNNLDIAAMLRFLPTKNSSIELAYAQKMRSPNLYERYAWSTGGMAMRMINTTGDGNGYVGNIDLKPEVAQKLAVDFKLFDQAQTWQLSVAPHYSKITDYIDAVRCKSSNMNCGRANQNRRNGFVYLQYQNQDAVIYGADISMQYKLATTNNGTFTTVASISKLKGENKTSADYLYNIMPFNARLALVHQLGNYSSSLELESVAAKKDLSKVRNEVATSSYELLHLYLNYKWQQLQLNFGIENALNLAYQPALGGAYTGQGVTMSGNGVPWGNAVYGKGRSFMLGAELSF